MYCRVVTDEVKKSREGKEHQSFFGRKMNSSSPHLWDKEGH